MKTHPSLRLAFSLIFSFFNLQVSAQAELQADPDLQVFENQLSEHPSPYLALHGSDPVAWQDWGPEVLERAKRENKLILLSSGYFSCHWCHVMQRESYKNEAVATILNSAYIPVKIDRELEPALDKRLMGFAQSTLKRGGWPLNVFMSPDGLPVYAVLYQPQAQFLGLLNRLTGLWQQQSERIRSLALAEKIPVSFPDTPPTLETAMIGELRDLGIEKILQRADELEGGFGQSNKFPSVPQLDFLLESLANAKDKAAVTEFLQTTLDAMADQGMRDHLSGGFFRYVVDPSWEIPHFEKMLYDNANLAHLYLKAGEKLNTPKYTAVARDTLDFMISHMSSDNGALVASFSAVDDNDIEGGYYLWQTEQLKAALSSEEYRVFSTRWNTTRPADLEEGNHLRDAKPIQALATELGLAPAEISSLLIAARDKLSLMRQQRVLPTDDKLIAGWNAQALSAFSVAVSTLDEPLYRAQAQKIRNFLVDTLWQDGRLRRSLAKGKLLGSAAIEDYAYVAQGLYDWAQLAGNEDDFSLVEAVLSAAWDKFHQNNAWSYADTSILPPADGEEILSEDASASPSAVIIRTTIALHNSGKLKKPELYKRALSALNRGDTRLRGSPFWYATQIAAMQIVRP